MEALSFSDFTFQIILFKTKPQLQYILPSRKILFLSHFTWNSSISAITIVSETFCAETQPCQLLPMVLDLPFQALKQENWPTSLNSCGRPTLVLSPTHLLQKRLLLLYNKIIFIGLKGMLLIYKIESKYRKGHCWLTVIWIPYQL